MTKKACRVTGFVTLLAAVALGGTVQPAGADNGNLLQTRRRRRRRACSAGRQDSPGLGQSFSLPPGRSASCRIMQRLGTEKPSTGTTRRARRLWLPAERAAASHRLTTPPRRVRSETKPANGWKSSWRSGPGRSRKQSPSNSAPPISRRPFKHREEDSELGWVLRGHREAISKLPDGPREGWQELWSKVHACLKVCARVPLRIEATLRSNRRHERRIHEHQTDILGERHPLAGRDRCSRGGRPSRSLAPTTKSSPTCRRRGRRACCSGRPRDPRARAAMPSTRQSPPHSPSRSPCPRPEIWAAAASSSPISQIAARSSRLC